MSMPNLSLEGKVAVITGGSRGIGRSIALVFAEAGADVVVCSRKLEGGLGDVAKEIQALGRRSLAVPADITQAAAVDNLVKRTMAEFGAVDILVNNAGTVLKAAVVEHSEEDWDRVMDTNLKGYYLCSKAVGKIMIDRKKGNIISIASFRAFRGGREKVSYCVSKAGVMMLTRGLALEMVECGIRVNAIAPGWIQTKLSEYLWSDPKVYDEITALIPMGRWGKPSEMANIALFLASDASSYITGHTLVADGGWLLDGGGF